MISLIMVYRTRSEQDEELWGITLNAIEGILRTADYPFELILIDNASHDMRYAYDVARRATVFDAHCEFIKGFKHYRFEEHVSLAKAWNTGLNQVDGEYVLIANNDIVFHERGWMSRMLEPFSWSDRKIGIV